MFHFTSPFIYNMQYLKFLLLERSANVWVLRHLHENLKCLRTPRDQIFYWLVWYCELTDTDKEVVNRISCNTLRVVILFAKPASVCWRVVVKGPAGERCSRHAQRRALIGRQSGTILVVIPANGCVLDHHEVGAIRHHNCRHYSNNITRILWNFLYLYLWIHNINMILFTESRFLLAFVSWSFL